MLHLTKECKPAFLQHKPRRILSLYLPWSTIQIIKSYSIASFHDFHNDYYILLTFYNKEISMNGHHGDIVDFLTLEASSFARPPLRPERLAPGRFQITISNQKKKHEKTIGILTLDFVQRQHKTTLFMLYHFISFDSVFFNMSVFFDTKTLVLRWSHEWSMKGTTGFDQPGLDQFFRSQP